MLTRFERARVLGARNLQISLGAPVLVKVPSGMTKASKIVEEEFKKGVLPISIVRRKGTTEYLVDLNGKEVK